MGQQEEILLGNGAIGLGLLESGCRIVTSYPGTSSSEILPEVVRLVEANELDTYVEWSTNEKVALETAFAACLTGKRAACCMRQMGLNAAADSLRSAAHMGTVGGMVVISCDDPGPHASQTQSDTRLMARLAKVPVLDPSTPREAREMIGTAFEISEEFRIPVIVRPATRVCHAVQNLSHGGLEQGRGKGSFKKDPVSRTATPGDHLVLHAELNRKLANISKKFESLSRYNFHNLEPSKEYPLGIIAAGVPYSAVHDLLREEERTDIPLLKIGTPFPFPENIVSEFTSACRSVLVLEETDTLIEYLLHDRKKVLGRISGHVPAEGELVPEVIHTLVNRTLRENNLNPLRDLEDSEATEIVKKLQLPVRRPTLCPGCPHRAALFSIREARPKAIFTSDMGCHTLGTNRGAVDTCLEMGGGITMASGFHHSFAQDRKEQPIVATIGDSTFFHSGTAGLINAVSNGARFILVILDSLTTATTAMRTTPALGIRADGSEGKSISLERAVAGCGVDYIQVLDPYDIKSMTESLKKAAEYVAEPEGGMAVLIARHPCPVAYTDETGPSKRVVVTEKCEECNFCLDSLGCPALYHDPELGRTAIHWQICSGCGVCLQICPKGAIEEAERL